MPDDRKKISALPSALTLDNTDVLPIVQGMNSTPETKKAAITLLATHLLELMSYNNLSTANKTIVGAINSLLSNFADAYDDTSTYDVGDCVIYNGVLYQCNTAITVAEEWDATHWTAVKAVDVGAGGLPSEIIADEYDSTLTYSVGDYVIYEEEFYICNTEISVAEAWNAAHWTQIQVSSELKLKADKKAVEEALENMLPIANASGAIANFNTELNLDLISLKAAIVATQASGTPTTSIPIPISGWSEIKIRRCGKNLVDIRPFNEWQTARVSYYVLRNSVPNKVINVSLIDKDTTVDLTGVSFGFVDSSWDTTEQLTASEYRWVIQGGTPQTIKRNTAIGDSKNILTGLMISPQTEEAYNKIMARYYFEFEIDTATEYEAYNGKDITIALGDTYYGGYVTQDKDGHRELTVTCAKEHISLQGKTYETANGLDAWIVYLANRSMNAGSSANKLCNICNNYRYEGSSVNTEHYYITQQAVVIYLFENTFRDGEFDIVYPLETPFTVALSDGEPINALIGTNNLFADSGDILECKYKDTIQHYIDTQIAATQALIL